MRPVNLRMAFKRCNPTPKSFTWSRNIMRRKVLTEFAGMILRLILNGQKNRYERSYRAIFLIQTLVKNLDAADESLIHRSQHNPVNLKARLQFARQSPSAMPTFLHAFLHGYC